MKRMITKYALVGLFIGSILGCGTDGTDALSGDDFVSDLAGNYQCGDLTDFSGGPREEIITVSAGLLNSVSLRWNGLDDSIVQSMSSSGSKILWEDAGSDYIEFETGVDPIKLSLVYGTNNASNCLKI